MKEQTAEFTGVWSKAKLTSFPARSTNFMPWSTRRAPSASSLCWSLDFVAIAIHNVTQLCSWIDKNCRRLLLLLGRLNTEPLLLLMPCKAGHIKVDIELTQVQLGLHKRRERLPFIELIAVGCCHECRITDGFWIDFTSVLIAMCHKTCCGFSLYIYTILHKSVSRKRCHYMGEVELFYHLWI